MADLTAPTQTRALSPKLKAVLLFDSQQGSRLMTKWFLSTFGFVVNTCAAVEPVLAILETARPDILILQNLSGTEASQLAARVKAKSPGTPVLLFTSEPPQDRRCLDCLVKKPAHLLVLKEAIDRLINGERSADGMSCRA